MRGKRRVVRLLAAAGLMALAAACRADIVADIMRRVPPRPQSYAQVVAALGKLRGSERVTLYNLGRSAGGRDIYGVVVKAPQVPLESCARLLVVARQHGNEPAGTEAALALLKHFAASQGEIEKATLDQLAFMVVPVANPDGASAGRRSNGNGADLNRDWVRQNQPETRAIQSAILAWRPHAVMDLHELPASSGKPSYQENFVETIGATGGTSRRVSSHTIPTVANLEGWLRTYGHRTNVYFDGASRDRGLFHRHCGLDLHIPSYLVETKTGSGRTLAQRASFQVLGMLVVANHVVNHQVPQGGGAGALTVAQEPVAGEEAVAREVELVVGEVDEGGRVRLEARVTPPGTGDVVKFVVDGRLRAVGNVEPYLCDLRAQELGPGEHEVGVLVVGPEGGVLAEASRQVNFEDTMMGE